MCKQCQALQKAIDAYLTKADASMADELEDEGYVKGKRTLEYLNDMEDEVAGALTAETDYVLREAEKSVDLETFAKKVWPTVMLNDETKAKLLEIFKETLTKFVPEFAGYYLAGLEDGLKITRVSKRTTDWVKSWSSDLADLMQLNSHKEIENILVKGLERGDSIPQFTRAILDSGIRDEYYKARRVAITEVLTAHRVAQQEAFLQSPATGEKEWVHTGVYIHEPRQNHVDMNGVRVPKTEPFTLRGADGSLYYPMEPGDTSLPASERINCHCTMAGIPDEKAIGLPLEERERLRQEALDEADENWEAELEARNKAMVGYTD